MSDPRPGSASPLGLSSVGAAGESLSLSQLAGGRHFILLYETGVSRSFVDSESLGVILDFLVDTLENNMLRYAGIGSKTLYYDENDVAAFVASFQVLTLLSFDQKLGAYKSHGPQVITRYLVKHIRGR